MSEETPAVDFTKLNLDPARAIEARDKLNATLSAHRAAWEAKEKDIKAKIETLEKFLEHYLVTVMKADSARFGNKSVTRVENEEVRVDDWSTFMHFLADNKLPTLLQKRVGKTELLRYAKEKGMPPGVYTVKNYSLRITTVNTKKK